MKGRITYKGDKRLYFIDHKEVTREEFDAAFPKVEEPNLPPTGLIAWHRPIDSDAMAFHKDQVPEAREFFAKRGITGVDVLPDGKVRFADRGARRAALKAQGMRDNQGGYSD